MYEYNDNQISTDRNFIKFRKRAHTILFIVECNIIYFAFNVFRKQ